MAKTKTKTIYAQGDILIERVKEAPAAAATVGEAGGGQYGIDPDGSRVLARGEVTGHRHRFAPTSDVALFRDEAFARDMPASIYIGHIKVPAAGADLVHEEHDTIALPPGTYRIRRQREFSLAHGERVVAD